jgi:hypothetical protein
MRRSTRSRRPAAGQLLLVFLGDVPVAEAIPTPVIELAEVLPAPVADVTIPSPTTPAPVPTSPSPVDRAVPSRTRPRFSESRRDRTTARWLKRGAACLLCGAWPVPVDHVIEGRMVVLCKGCDAQPNARARMVEIVTEDWRQPA